MTAYDKLKDEYGPFEFCPHTVKTDRRFLRYVGPFWEDGGDFRPIRFGGTRDGSIALAAAPFQVDWLKASKGTFVYVDSYPAGAHLNKWVSKAEVENKRGCKVVMVLPNEAESFLGSTVKIIRDVEPGKLAAIFT